MRQLTKQYISTWHKNNVKFNYNKLRHIIFKKKTEWGRPFAGPLLPAISPEVTQLLARSSEGGY